MTGTIEGGDEQTRLTPVSRRWLRSPRLVPASGAWGPATSLDSVRAAMNNARDADPSGAATLWAHKALSAGRPLPFGVEVVSRFTVAAPAEEESWRSTSR